MVKVLKILILGIIVINLSGCPITKNFNVSNVLVKSKSEGNNVHILKYDNGTYTGELLRNIRHGKGVYVWKDNMRAIGKMGTCMALEHIHI